MNKKDYSEKYVSALKLFIETGNVSASYIQRKLCVGYCMATSILDQLESDGYISISERKVLITKQQFENEFVNDAKNIQIKELKNETNSEIKRTTNDEIENFSAENENDKNNNLDSNFENLQNNNVKIPYKIKKNYRLNQIKIYDRFENEIKNEEKNWIENYINGFDDESNYYISKLTANEINNLVESCKNKKATFKLYRANSKNFIKNIRFSKSQPFKNSEKLWIFFVTGNISIEEFNNVLSKLDYKTKQTTISFAVNCNLKNRYEIGILAI